MCVHSTHADVKAACTTHLLTEKPHKQAAIDKVAAEIAVLDAAAMAAPPGPCASGRTQILPVVSCEGVAATAASLVYPKPCNLNLDGLTSGSDRARPRSCL